MKKENCHYKPWNSKGILLYDLQINYHHEGNILLIGYVVEAENDIYLKKSI